MTGERLKNLLASKDLTQTKIAEILGIAQQTLNKKFSSDSIKTSFIEELCDKLDLDLYFFYGGTKYLPVMEGNNDKQSVPKYLYDERLQENYAFRDQIKELQMKIALLESSQNIKNTEPTETQNVPDLKKDAV